MKDGKRGSARKGTKARCVVALPVVCLVLFASLGVFSNGGALAGAWAPGSTWALADVATGPLTIELLRVGLDVATKWEVVPEFDHVIFEGAVRGTQVGSSEPAPGGITATLHKTTQAAKEVARGRAGEKWSVTAEGSSIRLASRGGSSLLVKSPLRFEFSGTTGGETTSKEGLRFSLNGRRYRGIVEFTLAPGGLQAINELPLDEYLYGVIPKEMPASWPAEALKAQAVAARTYALFILNSGKYASQGFDIRATRDDQVYGGLDGEDLRTNRAVDETRGEVLCYDGKPIQAFFHSSSGGHTEDSRIVWGSSLPYLRGVPDFDQDSPHYEWVETIPMETINEKLRSQGLAESPVTGVRLGDERGVSGRPSKVILETPSGDKELQANSFRLAVGLKSTLFELTKLEPRLSEVRTRYAGSDEVSVVDKTGTAQRRRPSGSVAVDGRGNLYRLEDFTAVGMSRIPSLLQFKGRGMGHGVGMSQWGAKALAGKHGYDYRQILEYYYTGVNLIRLRGGNSSRA